MDTEGVFIGRLNPMTIGHESVIHTMIERHGRKNCVVALGSVNTPCDLTNNLFSFSKRVQYVRTIFPDVRIVGLPDFGRDEDWLLNLSLTLDCLGKNPVHDCVFYTGSVGEYTASLLSKQGFTLCVQNRFAGRGAGISATQVRNALRTKDYAALDGLINPLILDDIIKEAECLYSDAAFMF